LKDNLKKFKKNLKVIYDDKKKRRIAKKNAFLLKIKRSKIKTENIRGNPNIRGTDTGSNFEDSSDDSSNSNNNNNDNNDNNGNDTSDSDETYDPKIKNEKNKKNKNYKDNDNSNSEVRYADAFEYRYICIYVC
jgi:hypothetical protein